MPIVVPDTSDNALMRCAREFDRPFSAAEFCQRLYRSEWGHGPFVTGVLKRLVNKGLLEKAAKRGHKTFYRVVEETPECVPDPECQYCAGSGEVLWHTDDCRNDDCALNGDIDSCDGQIEPCTCLQPTPKD